MKYIVNNLLILIFFIYSSLISIYPQTQKSISILYRANYFDYQVKGEKESTGLWFDKWNKYYGIGMSFNYDLVLFEYCTNNSLSRHMIHFDLCKKNIFYNNTVDYSRGFQRTQNTFNDTGPGWDESYNTNMDDMKLFRNNMQAGYFLTYYPFQLKPVSYKAVYYQNENLEQYSFFLGVPTAGVYNYTYMTNDEILIPEGERPYYDKAGTLKGEKSHYFGMKMSPLVGVSFQKIYCVLQFDYILFPYVFAAPMVKTII